MQRFIRHYDLFCQIVRLKKAMSRWTFFCFNAALTRSVRKLIGIWCFKQYRQSTYDATQRCVRATIVLVEKQRILHILGMCVALCIQHAMLTHLTHICGRPGSTAFVNITSYFINDTIFDAFDRASPLICGNKMPTKSNRWFLYCRVMCPVCGMLQHPANRTHNPQLYTRPTTWKPKLQIPQAATTCIVLLSSWWWA